MIPEIGATIHDEILDVVFTIKDGPFPSQDPKFPDEMFWDVDSSDGFGTVRWSDTAVRAGLAKWPA